MTHFSAPHHVVDSSCAEGSTGRLVELTGEDRAARPREKLLAEGVSALADTELLAVLFGTGTRGQSAQQLAEQLLCNFGGLRQLLLADQSNLCATAGIGPARFALLQAAIELGKRCARESLNNTSVISSPEAVREYLGLHYVAVDHEVFSVMFLDNKHKVIACKDMFRGTIDTAAVYPREVLKECLSLNAAAVILAHNHPSGDADPSAADIAITRKLQQALGLLDIRVLDHLVVGNGVQVSLAEQGHLTN